MLAILTIVTPVFGLILLGWLVARVGYLQQGTGKVLSEFAFNIAMPALLFRATLQAGELSGQPLKLLAAYFGATFATWIAATLISSLVLRRPAADAASVAMGCTFGNTVMLGIPLAISAFGPAAAGPMALLVSVETPLLWALATIHMTIAAHDGKVRIGEAMRSIGLDLLRNPIVTSLLLGTVCRMAGLELPPLPDKLLALLGQAALPTALVAVGMSLASYAIRGQLTSVAAISGMKLLVYPAFAYVLAFRVLDLPPLWSSIALLFASMPVGVNAYLFAARYDRAVEPVSAAISISTAIAVATVSGVLFALGKGTG